jgi:nucleoside-diphosphate-sugar epimerase
MSKILVTGGAGMIGSNLVKRLVSLGNEVRVVDNLWRGKIEYLYDNHGEPVIDLEKDFFNRDLSQPGACDDLMNDVDYVYHLADVVAGVEYVFNNQGTVFRHNILINSHVIESVRRNIRSRGKTIKGGGSIPCCPGICLRLEQINGRV